ncbi:MAG: alpha/beta fold hydrolase [Polyangia bacterium]|jgi:carboxylesterase|nr:alpha/beta fold hydrolase [Polyangia bacterium]
MDREQIAFTALKPADAAIGLAVDALEKSGKLGPLGDPIYSQLRNLFRKLFESQNGLEVEGLENVPEEGGVLFASNHQSWDDVQVIGATCPRRLRFIAKSEFETWPVLRHLIRLTDSPFIRRGGDPEAIAKLVQVLRNGHALCIFPESTIPGEEEVPRHAVEAETGLLPGKTGVVRLAMEAGVPVVPVGVSGTGAAFPPEIYPRLEILELPRKVPITVRYGRPLRFSRPEGGVPDREDLRRETNRLMRAISSLVDHGRNYVPTKVPIPPLPKHERLGVLLLHGFTSSLRTVDGLVPYLEAAGLPYRMPILRGHGTKWEDLQGVTAADWYADAEAALVDLAREVDAVAVVGLSMGGLVALELAMNHPMKVGAVVTVAGALRFKDPLTRLTPVLAKVARSWPSPESFNDLTLRSRSENYPRFTTDSFLSLYSYSAEIEKRLGEVRSPICVLQSKTDQVIAPISANLIYERVASEHREIHWFKRSGHEMMQDCEAEAVLEQIMEYLGKLRARSN